MRSAGRQGRGKVALSGRVLGQRRPPGQLRELQSRGPRMGGNPESVSTASRGSNPRNWCLATGDLKGSGICCYRTTFRNVIQRRRGVIQDKRRILLFSAPSLSMRARVVCLVFDVPKSAVRKDEGEKLDQSPRSAGRRGRANTCTLWRAGRRRRQCRRRQQLCRRQPCSPHSSGSALQQPDPRIQAHACVGTWR